LQRFAKQRMPGSVKSFGGLMTKPSSGVKSERRANAAASLRMKKTYMPKTHATEMIFIRENAALPPNFRIESEAFIPGWRVIKNLDGYALERKCRNLNWSFAPLIGEKKARVLGPGGKLTLRKGVTQILAGLSGRKFNLLEISVVTARRFLGMTYLSISANRRMLQDNLVALPL
jgi:hypothetical protein